MIRKCTDSIGWLRLKIRKCTDLIGWLRLMIKKCTDSIGWAQTDDQKMYSFDRVGSD